MPINVFHLHSHLVWQCKITLCRIHLLVTSLIHLHENHGSWQGEELSTIHSTSHICYKIQTRSQSIVWQFQNVSYECVFLKQTKPWTPKHSQKIANTVFPPFCFACEPDSNNHSHRFLLIHCVYQSMSHNIWDYCTHTVTLDARGFLREEPWNGDKRSAKWWRERK